MSQLRTGAGSGIRAAVASHSEKRKSALVLTHNFPRYQGDMSGVFLKHLLSALRESVDFTVLAPHDSGLPDSESTDGMDIRRFHYAADDEEVLAYRGEMHTQIATRPFALWRFMRSYKRAAIRLVRDAAFDFVWAHWWMPGGWIARKAKAGADIPLLVTCHGTDVFLLNKFPWLKGTAARVFAGASAITVVSAFLRKQITDALSSRIVGIEEKVIVAPMAVDASVFFRDESIEPTPGSIISASRLTPQKHIDKLILAASMLQRDGVSFSLDVYGDGPERTKLSALVAESNLAGRVRLNGPVSQCELADRYRRSQIAVLASEREGFGLALLEAMLCGCAAVGARSGGITDIVADDGNDGILVEERDAHSLYRGLKRLLTDDDELKRIRHRGYASVSARFSDKAVCHHYQEILTRL